MVSLSLKRSPPQKSTIVEQRETDKVLPSSGSCLEVLIKSYSSPRSLPTPMLLHAGSVFSSPAVPPGSLHVPASFTACQRPGSSPHLPLSALAHLTAPSVSVEMGLLPEHRGLSPEFCPLRGSFPCCLPPFSLCSQGFLFPAPHSLHSAAPFAVTHSHMFSACLTSHPLLKQS